MLGFAETFGATLGSFLVPSLVGLLIISAAARYVRPIILAAFTIGLYFWFFSDTIGDASLIGVSEGFTGGVFHVALWVAFAAGLIFMFASDSSLFAEGSSEGIGFAIPVLVALAVGVHGFGEGAAIGGTAATTPSANILDAFGGFSAAVSFLLHKGLEPMMVGAAYWIYAKDHARTSRARLADILVLVLVFSIPGILGSAVAYYLVQVYPSADFTYIFAIGLGTSIYAAMRLARPLFQGSLSSAESVKIGVTILLGFTCLYLAALLHS